MYIKIVLESHWHCPYHGRRIIYWLCQPLSQGQSHFIILQTQGRSAILIITKLVKSKKQIENATVRIVTLSNFRSVKAFPNINVKWQQSIYNRFRLCENNKNDFLLVVLSKLLISHMCVFIRCLYEYITNIIKCSAWVFANHKIVEKQTHQSAGLGNWKTYEWPVYQLLGK